MIENKDETKDSGNNVVKEPGEITEERKETKEEEEYRKAIYALDDLLVFVKEPTKSPRAQRREKKIIAEIIRKRVAEDKALLEKMNKKE